ncbi:hypothetical protein PYW07_011776 [Mythimna separata]|uniref:BPTI/Kunitz inhibitor domain-containing protein n=1 Tax=Mythimna separata TaxID=271217 RepID=A0AAD8DK76_MYTSE|nr:hypothetical protein PYW07_011776 [Mythimna separata]
MKLLLCFLVIFLVAAALADTSINPICLLPRETGMCRASMPRYGYNPESGKCEKFTYGGCRGNSNNFLTVEECEDACSAS